MNRKQGQYPQRIIRDPRNADLDLWSRPFNWHRDAADRHVELSNGRWLLVGDLNYCLTNHAPCTQSRAFIGREAGQ